MVAKLNELGCNVDLERVKEIAGKGAPRAGARGPGSAGKGICQFI